MLIHIKKIAIAVAFILMFSSATSPFVKAEEVSKKEFVDFDLESINSIDDIPKELLDPNFYSEDEIIKIPLEYFNPSHPDTIDTIFIGNNSKKGEIHTSAIAAAAGVYLIPGIGPVALTVTGAVVIGGVTIAAGSWLYNKISYYFSKKAADAAAKKVPKSLKKSEGKVDLKKFKDKHGKTPAQKTSGTFKNGKWVITKDVANHIGYNGNKKAWKIGNPTRKASLDKYGNVISE
ncbi:hypothetical protein ABEX69_05345 [Bacillus safensis]|uniref:hypothetical protein n=2 Tax=Bacillus safensis TaxID=561879 RepID=UPI00227E968B|nr:hypothetical protein [Bacillus safensis]MCY7566289.1 hypothetical protein [Bacillus safensis]MCY7624582.1 hypothetical protein [Bacillus safensis]MCY7631651.1 hypothetical protein [Bacillus safensis]MCY7647926.1 hypothetical protein [Bacillus safensis]MCY7653323.1 hypothetical protein [Bacillus safensis]